MITQRTHACTGGAPLRTRALPFVLLLFLVTVLDAQAQQPTRIARIGFLSPSSSSDSGGPILLETFRQRLGELGYVEGRTLIIETRWADGHYERLPGLAAELVRLKVDVIVAVAVPAIKAAKDATTTIPIVMASVVDPVETGLVTSLARPGGNVTGLSSTATALVGKQLELLKEISPKASRVGALWNPTNRGNTAQLREAELAAKTLGIQLHPVEARRPTDLDGAFATMAKQRAEAIIVLVDVMLSEQRPRVAALAAQARLPAVYGLSEHAEAGGLVSYSANRPELFRRAASYVDKILKGATPADLPIEQPTRFELIVNLRTAKALAITIPPSVVVRADRVIQ